MTVIFVSFNGGNVDKVKINVVDGGNKRFAIVDVGSKSDMFRFREETLYAGNVI